MTCWDLIDTTAMIGSPALRAATSSLGGAGRVCLGAASAFSAVNTTTAASVTIAGDFQHPIAAADRTIAIRFSMSFPVEMPVSVASLSVGDRGDVGYWHLADIGA